MTRIKMHISYFAIILVTLACHNAYAQTFQHVEGFINVPGGKLHYETYNSRRSTGTPIIVLHGGPDIGSGYLLPQMSVLAKHSITTFYDQRGTGKSLGFELNEQTVNIDRFVEDVEAVRQQLGYDKVILLGHSWGGMLANNYAIKYPERVAALILVSSGPANSKSFSLFFEEFKKRMQSVETKMQTIRDSIAFKNLEPSAITAYYQAYFTPYFYIPSKVKELSLQFTGPSFTSGSEVGKILGKTYFANYDMYADLQKFKMPVLIVHGVNDIIPVDTARETHNLIPGSKLVLIPKCDHFPYIERPQQFFKALRDFIQTYSLS